MPSWKVKNGKGNRNSEGRTTGDSETESVVEPTETIETGPVVAPTETTTKSRYLRTAVLRKGDLKMLSKKWVQLDPDHGLILGTDPLGNMLDQVINMIKMYGVHHKKDLEKAPPSYATLLRMLESHIEQPCWWAPNLPFSPSEYLIRGYEGDKATTPRYAHKIINKILGQCSNLMLEKKNQTASWRRLFNRHADNGIYAVFFKVIPLRNETMYDETMVNNGEYLQMAIVDNLTRIVLPGNHFGTGIIIGRDIEDICDERDRSADITDILNARTSGNTRGLCPSQECPRKKKTVIMQGTHEIMEVPLNTMCNRQEDQN